MQKPDIWMNGEFVRHEDANVHVLTHALHYGTSVFEGIRCYNTENGPAIFRNREHMQRLLDSARIYRMDLGYSLAELDEAAIETVSRSGMDECYLRPLAYRAAGPMGVNPYNNPVHTVIAVWKWGTYLGPEALEYGVDVQVASWSRMAPNTFPSMAKAGGNYLNAGLVKMDAVLNGFSEGIMLSVNGHLAEGSGENLFLVRNGELFTAPVSMSILPGITRHTIMQLARDMGLTVHEGLIPREALYVADEVFFTGTAAEVTPIRTVDHHVIGEGRRGEITGRLQQAFFDIVRKGNDPYGWLTPVAMAQTAS